LVIPWLELFETAYWGNHPPPAVVSRRHNSTGMCLDDQSGRHSRSGVLSRKFVRDPHALRETRHP